MNSFDELQDRIEVHFADQEDDEGVSAMREELQANPGLARRLRRQLDTLLGDDSSDCLSFIQQHANRTCDFSEDEARAWLRGVRERVFENID